MSAFEYEALDRQGRRHRGVVVADTARLARKDLQLRKLVPLTVEPTNATDKTSKSKWFTQSRKRVSSRDLSLLTRQLATMLDAGAPLEGALQTLVQQSEKPALRSVLSGVRSDVMEGYTLSDSLARQGSAFSPFYRALVGAGEASGSLAAVLERLSVHLERAQEIRGKVITACVYPLVLAVTAFAVLAALITFVVPKVVEQFDSMGQDLPWLTTFVMGLSEVAQSYGLIFLVAIAVLIALAARILSNRTVREKADMALLHVPLIGRLMRDLQAARLARTLSTLISCGAPVVDGLKAAHKTMQNTILQNAIDSVIRKVQEGKALSAALRATNVFPPLLIYMVAIGESSGRLDTMLTKSADHLESEFETFTATALSLLEPAIIIVMGGVVATIVLAILLPILQLNSLALM